MKLAIALFLSTVAVLAETPQAKPAPRAEMTEVQLLMTQKQLADTQHELVTVKIQLALNNAIEQTFKAAGVSMDEWELDAAKGVLQKRTDVKAPK